MGGHETSRRGNAWMARGANNSRKPDGKAGMSVTRRYLLLPISHGSISIKFITVFAANVANGSVRYLLRSAAADGSFRSPLPPRRFISSSIRFIFLPLRNIAYYDPYTRPLCASFRELFPTGGRDISVDCLMTDLATDVSSWNSSGDHSYLTFPGARFFFFLISFFFLIGIIGNCVIHVFSNRRFK